MKIPRYIREDYHYYKQSKNFKCKNCKQYFVNFTYMSFQGDQILYHSNCAGCGEDYAMALTYKILRKIYFGVTKSKNPTDVKLKDFWNIFRLGVWYKEVFKHEKEKVKFDRLLVRLNKETSGWRKYFYGWRV